MKLPKVINSKKYVYCIAYIDVDFIDRVEKDLKKSPEYKKVEAFIPTVNVLKKVHKGKNKFEKIPLLFNYGFFKIPRIYAQHSAYLENMRENIPCIISWVKDPMKKVNAAIKNDKKRRKQHNLDSKVPCGTATGKEVAGLLSESFKFSIHTAQELEKLKAGDYIILKGYPWEGMEAELISIDAKREKAMVNIVMFDSKREMEVSFDNVFFTIYHNSNYDDSISTKASLDEMKEKKTLDRLTFKNYAK